MFKSPKIHINLTNLLNFIAILNRDFNFENILQNLDGQFIHFGYENIIELVNDYDSTCEFIEYLSKKGFSAAKESLIKILTLIPGTNNQIRIAKDLFDSTTKYCTDENTSKKLTKTFEFLYENSDDIQTCGGDIDILVITKDESFWKQHKIYNPLPSK